MPLVSALKERIKFCHYEIIIFLSCIRMYIYIIIIHYIQDISKYNIICMYIIYNMYVLYIKYYI